MTDYLGEISVLDRGIIPLSNNISIPSPHPTSFRYIYYNFVFKS
jgi:hypothetical protein